ncbi:hypothetical protein [Gordonia sp. ABSL49_1]|uniref:hypothetical protein n=1 Tax=Gordonia sp. ABSL49_1 TaxID=2920941 RepID=UPI001F1073C7|nr:hypothetical protein [Gordonia sp. ABSL49_1]MCH5641438.1 hypothetical protein [Gordonia sp. ABSL49_1]
MVDGQAVADFLGRGSEEALAAMAEQHAAIVTAMAQAYTRGGGFTNGEPTDDVAAVITTATARLLTNPGQLDTDDSMGPMRVVIRGSFTGWTLAELFVLNRYRKRAQ